MLKKIIFNKIFLIVISIFISSCTKKVNQNEKVLNLAVSAEIKGMDPIRSNDMYSSNEVARVYEGLLEYSYLKRPYELKANLAESMPKVSKDGLVYTFKVRKGVFFQDDPAFKDGKGRELVAEDFVYSIKRLADSKLQGLGWWLLSGKIEGLDEWRKKAGSYDEVVSGLKTLDKYTIQFKLKKPFPQFLYSLAMTFTFAVAKEVVDKYGKEFINHPIGTGPFVIDGGVYKQSNKIKYSVNKNFREKKFPCEASDEFKDLLKSCGKKIPFVKKIVVNIMKEDQPRWLNFNKGKVDFVGIPKDNFDSAVPDAKNLSPELKKNKVKLFIGPSLDVTYIAFNHDNKLFKNLKLRQAMSLAYNSNKANKLFYNNTALVAQSVVPPGIIGHIKGYKNPFKGYGTAESIDKAKKLLVEAGYPGGRGLPEITYDCTSTTTARQMGEYFQKEMAQIGIKVRVIQNSWPQLTEKVTKRKIMTFGMAWSADYPDAENFLQLIYGPNKAPGANGSGYNSKKFNELFSVSSIMQAGSKRTAMYEEMYKIAAENVPWIFGVHRQNYTPAHAWLINYTLTDFTQGQALYLDIDTKIKKEIINNL